MNRVKLILSMVLASTLLWLSGGALANDPVSVISIDYYAANASPVEEQDREEQADSDDCD